MIILKKIAIKLKLNIQKKIIQYFYYKNIIYDIKLISQIILNLNISILIIIIKKNI